PGLSHLFESVIAERRREIEQSHAAAKRAEATTYRAELDALKRAYTALIDRHSRALDAEDRDRAREATPRTRSAAQERPEVQGMSVREAQRRIILAKMRQTKREITQESGYAYRRPSKRRPPEDGED